MAGLLLETLALTRRIERFQSLHAVLLLIGGVRRARPEFCETTIKSFPLHNFYYDSVSANLGLDGMQIIETLFQTTQEDVVSLNLTVDTFALLELLFILNIEDSVSAELSLLSLSLIDSGFVNIDDSNAIADFVTTSLTVESFQMLDTVVGMSPADEVVTMNLVIDTMALEDV